MTQLLQHVTFADPTGVLTSDKFSRDLFAGLGIPWVQGVFGGDFFLPDNEKEKQKPIHFPTLKNRIEQLSPGPVMLNLEGGDWATVDGSQRFSDEIARRRMDIVDFCQETAREDVRFGWFADTPSNDHWEMCTLDARRVKWEANCRAALPLARKMDDFYLHAYAESTWTVEEWRWHCRSLIDVVHDLYHRPVTILLFADGYIDLWNADHLKEDYSYQVIRRYRTSEFREIFGWLMEDSGADNVMLFGGFLSNGRYARFDPEAGWWQVFCGATAGSRQ